MIEQIIKEAATSQLIELKEDLLTTWQSSCESELFLDLVLKLSSMVADELKSRDSKPIYNVKSLKVALESAFGTPFTHFDNKGYPRFESTLIDGRELHVVVSGFPSILIHGVYVYYSPKLCRRNNPLFIGEKSKLKDLKSGSITAKQADGYDKVVATVQGLGLPFKQPDNP